MRVRVASILHSYTDGQSELEAEGATLAEVMADLESRFPGLRFRVIDEQDCVRPHVNLFVRRHLARDLTHPIDPTDTVHILASLSGG